MASLKQLKLLVKISRIGKVYKWIKPVIKQRAVLNCDLNQALWFQHESFGNCVINRLWRINYLLLLHPVLSSVTYSNSLLLIATGNVSLKLKVLTRLSISLIVVSVEVELMPSLLSSLMTCCNWNNAFVWERLFLRENPPFNPRTSKGGGGGVKWIPHSFFGPKIWSFQAIKMKLSVPVVW